MRYYAGAIADCIPAKQEDFVNYYNICLYTRFNVISGEKSGVSVHDTLPPSVIVLLHNVDNSAFVECQLILLVLLVAVDCHDYKQKMHISSQMQQFIPMMLFLSIDAN